MTTTPEAVALARTLTLDHTLVCGCGAAVLCLTHWRVAVLLTSHADAARRAALEEAALIAEGHINARDRGDYDAGESRAAGSIADDIRSLLPTIPAATPGKEQT